MKALILSKNKRLSRFFSIEAENFDFTTVSFERNISDASQYFLSIIDTDTIKDIPQVPSRFTIFVSANGSSKKDYLGEFLCVKYPIRINELRKIFADAKQSGAGHLSAQNNDSEKIYFYENSNNVVTYNGQNILLSETEIKLLTKLCQATPNAVSHNEIQEIFESKVGNAETVYICKLRKKLEEPFGKKIIFTVRGEGYKIAADSEWKKK